MKSRRIAGFSLMYDVRRKISALRSMMSDLNIRGISEVACLRNRKGVARKNEFAILALDMAKS